MPLNIVNVLAANTGTANEHVLICGVAVSQVPEPASLTLLAVSGIAMIRRRRA
jgi:MYXO-CTERM domain-containing protein